MNAIEQQFDALKDMVHSLLEEIENIKKFILESVESDVKNVIESNDFMLDLNMKKLFIKSHEKYIDLTETELVIIKIMITNNGNVFNRKQIAQKAYPGGIIFNTSENVGVHIHRIRNKIKKEIGNHEYLRSRNKRGYIIY